MSDNKTLVSGIGSEENPLCSESGTAGIVDVLEELSHGGCVKLSSSRYNISKTITLDSSSCGIEGEIWCCNTDPNGVFESDKGTKIRLMGKGFPAIRMGDKCDPISGAKISELGIQGDIDGMDTRPLVDFDNPVASAGICVDKVRCDQCHFTKISFCGIGNGVCLAGNAMMDGCVFDNLNVDGCGNGFYISNYACVYNHIRNCVAADTPYYGVYACGEGGKRIYNLEIMSTHFVRNAGAFLDGDGMIPAAVLLKDVDRCDITHCLFDAPGTFWYFRDDAKDNADKEIIKRKAVGLYIIGNGHKIQNNTFCNSSDDSIRIEGDNNILMCNVCDGNVRIKGKGTYISSIAFTKPEARLILEGEAKDTTVVFGVEESRIIRI